MQKPFEVSNQPLIGCLYVIGRLTDLDTGRDV